jgi:hypothetical protein
MALSAKTNTIRLVVAECWILGPRREMVDFDLSPANTAVLASPVITLSNGVSKCLVWGRGEISHSSRTVSPLPVRMLWAREACYDQRLMAYCLEAHSNSAPMFCRERPSQERCCNLISLLLWKWAASGRLACSGCADFLPCALALGWIAYILIDPSRSARAAAKPGVMLLIIYSTLVALFHSKNMGKVRQNAR